VRAAIVDIDGTLVDSNYQHALAWYRAYRHHGLVVPVWRIHRSVGMGGDHAVPAVAGDEVEAELGEAIRESERPHYQAMLDEIEPIEGAPELLAELRERGHTVILASSGKQEDVDRYLDLIQARELVHGWTTSADVEATKPEPDLVEAALEKAGTGDGVMIGDSIWDCEAARRAGIPSIGVLTGGFAASELREAGASRVFESINELRADLDAIDSA
jgi:HAD superfamily hydrolase (TIGR01549 family)